MIIFLSLKVEKKIYFPKISLKNLIFKVSYKLLNQKKFLIIDFFKISYSN